MPSHVSARQPSIFRGLQQYLTLAAILGLLTACGGSADNGSPGDTLGGGSGNPGSNSGGTSLVVSDPAPATYTWDTLKTGSAVYIDRSYTYSSIPSAYVGARYLQTANNDKTSSGPGFLSFTINKTVDVVIGHANDAASRPSWLDTWEVTGEVIVTTDRTLYLYKQTFDAGTVTLSGNENGASMYIVLIKDPGGTTTPPANSAPVITGTPATNATIGIAYSFTPSATDADGDALTFSISNLPSWATFNASNGTLSGTPGVGDDRTYNNIIISVSDGTASTPLASFSITVLPVSNGSATISWVPPTTNEDGSTLSNLAGYKIYYGTAVGNYPNAIDVNNPGLSSYVVGNLASNTYYFVVTAYDSLGTESAYSNVASKTIP